MEDVAAARARFRWSHTIWPWLQEEGVEIAEFEPAVWWRDNTVVLATSLDFGDGDPLDGLREDLLVEFQTVEPTVQAVVWEYFDPAVRRRRAHERVWVEPEDVGWRSAQRLVAPSMRRVLRQHVGESVLPIFAELSVVGVSRRRLWLVSRDPCFRSRVGLTSGAAYALLDAVGRATGRKKTDYTVVIDSEWPWTWRGLLDDVED